MKKLSILFSFLLFCIFAQAQSTTLNGTLVDPFGDVWSNATITAVFTEAPSIPGPYNWSGGAFNKLPPTVISDSSGNFSISLPSNSSIVPVGSTWLVSVCPNATSQCAVVNVSLTGSTYNIVPTLNGAQAWPTSNIPGTFISKVYSTQRMGPVPLSQGAIVYNSTTSQPQYWDGLSWKNFIGNTSVTSVGCVNANGISCTSSGGTSPLLTFSIGDINPSSLKINNSAPNGNVLIGNGSVYVNTSTLPYSMLTGTPFIPSNFYYQSAANNGSILPQQTQFNFTSPLVASNGAGQTNVTLATTSITPGTYTNPTVIFDAYGRALSASSNPPPPVTVTQNDMTGSRFFGSIYQNTSSSAIYVQGYGSTSGSNTGHISCLDGPTSPTTTIWASEYTATVSSGAAGFSCLIPAGYYYEITVTGAISGVTKWIESTL